jgi:hypothetical protein
MEVSPFFFLVISTNWSARPRGDFAHEAVQTRPINTNTNTMITTNPNPPLG